MEFNRCFGCMRELPTHGGVCPHCGFDNTKDIETRPSHVLPCGTVLNGQYVLGRSLGQGGFGITYIGYDLNLELPVCIKEYYPEGAAMRAASQSRTVYWGSSENAQNLKRGQESFVKEARKAAKLRDLDHVVTVWGVFHENDTAYIVMDYIEGETLKGSLIRKSKPLGEAECVKLLCPVMEDLEKAHARGIIHRDIKPDNLMLNTEGKVVLLDLGAAKDLSSGSGQSSFVVASQGFSPMEQYASGGAIGPWTDVYALCATIVWCASGRLLPPPMNRMNGEKINLDSFSPAFRAVLEKGLAIKPADRIQSVGELMAALKAAVHLGPEPELPPEKKVSLPIIVAALLLLAAISVFAVFTLTGGESSPAESSEPAAPASEAPETVVLPPAQTEVPAPSPTPETDRLILGTSADYAPFEFMYPDETGKLVYGGIDISIAQYVAGYMGRELMIQNDNFDNLLTDLQLGVFDMVIAAMEATDERRTRVDFSDPYFTDYPPTVLVRAENAGLYTSLDSFAGKSIGAQTATAKESIVRNDMPGAKLVSGTNVNDLINQLIHKKIDAVVLDGGVAAEYAANNKDLAAVALGEAYYYRIAVAKGDPKGLLPGINAAIDNMITNKKMDGFIAEAAALSDVALEISA